MDDILKFYIISTGKAAEAANIVKESDNNLNDALDKIGLRQNESKQEAIAYFKEWEQGRRMTEKNTGFLGKMLPDLRHLGGRLSTDYGNDCEIIYRTKAINTGWVQMGKFWHPTAPGRARE